MIKTLRFILISVLRFFKNRHQLELEIILLRHELLILQCKTKHPKLQNIDRILIVLISRFLDHRNNAVIILKPETVIRWHHKGFNCSGNGRAARNLGDQG